MICNYYKCNVDTKKSEGNLYFEVYGGYHDFVDTAFDSEPTIVVLCHKHAHKIFNNIYGYANYSSTSHNKKEPGYWFGHNRWENANIITLLIVLLRNPKTINQHIEKLLWLSKPDINNINSKPTIKTVVKQLFKFN